MKSVNLIISEYTKKYGLKNGEIIRVLRSIIGKIKNTSSETIIFSPEKVSMNDDETHILENMLLRYLKKEPLSKIINRKAFWNHDFFVNEHVLDPRSETEIIVQMVLERFSVTSPLRFLDLGTGSGCILLSLMSEFPHAIGLGLDLSQEAIRVAIHNREKLKLKNVDFLKIDWNSFLCNQKFDVIVSNPPYVKTSHIPKLGKSVRDYDPVLALDGGKSGLRAHEEISGLARKWLSPHGKIFLEIGRGQASKVQKILRKNRFKIEKIETDMNGLERAICAAVCV
ncbi:MAG: peptide chain release factor N(5)-glutamine methyltransferase [Holosporaceae bacterium]|nr:peptide chain release factor N(5)-glutamine methyltransferase [Holosporaceae bacterium]